MQKNAAVLTAACVLLCLTSNYTFPLHRQSNNWSLREGYYTNHSEVCHNVDHRAVSDRIKNKASNIENALKKIKVSRQDISRNIHGHLNAAKFSADKNILSEENLRQYEQLVMMKKYPYLDLKGLDFKYSPSSSKNLRQLKLELHSNFDNDPSLWEQMEEGPNIEIHNRGLSGFSIPSKPKSENMEDYKLKLNTNLQNVKNSESKALAKFTLNRNVLRNLQKYINNFEDGKLTTVY